MAYEKKIDWSDHYVTGLTKDLKSKEIDHLYFEFDYDGRQLELTAWSTWSDDGQEWLAKVQIPH